MRFVHLSQALLGLTTTQISHERLLNLLLDMLGFLHRLGLEKIICVMVAIVGIVYKPSHSYYTYHLLLVMWIIGLVLYHYSNVKRGFDKVVELFVDLSLKLR